jgi:lanosterol synthase
MGNCFSSCSAWFFAALFFVPTLASKLFVYVMLLLDSWNRAKVTQHQNNWKYDTVPHLRPSIKKELPASERAKWRLVCEEGRQRWFYQPDNKTPQRFVEQYSMADPNTNKNENKVKPRSDAKESLLDGIKFLLKLQDEDGHWPNDYSGPLFLTCGPVFAKYIMFRGDMDKCWTKEERGELIRYLVNIQNDDGGFGMHTEGLSTMFGTVLNYVVLRLLGAAKDDATVAAARKWIAQHGGAQTVPSWGKAWLSTLGLYEWAGVNAVSAELFLLPDWCPISLGKIWCHSRLVTIPFSWLYSQRWRCPTDPLLNAVRNELYSVVPYEQIKWETCRNNVQGADLYTPVSSVYSVVNEILLFYEHKLGGCKWLRDRALAKCYEHMRFDDTSTNYICLGPVNKCLNMLVTFIVEGSSIDAEPVKLHLERVPDYLWEGVDGMRMSGYNGSQLWDTSFALQAIFASPFVAQFKQQIANGHRYIDVAQVRDDPDNFEKFYRSRAKGAWNFSTRAQSWQVSDCTAEGLRVALLARAHPDVAPLITEPFDEQRLFDAVDTILALRDTAGHIDGSWASYEEPRAPKYYELLNCAEVYKDIMIDYTYAECTSSCVHSLILFAKQFPNYRRAKVQTAIEVGVREVKRKQRGDGSWYGSWGVCFTYAAWLATEALKLAGESVDSPVMVKACSFLLSKQNADGGWGEDFNSCVAQIYVPNPDGSQVVNTAWAVMALIAAGGGKRHVDAITRGVKLIMSRQLESGDWKQERISGVFNGNCAIHYPAYKNNMTVWALAKFVTECQ